MSRGQESQIRQRLRCPCFHCCTIRLSFGYTDWVKVIGHTRSPDWPKLGPSLIIATALVVAVRTAKWAAKASPDAHCSDIDHELDREVSFAIRITDRVLKALLQRKEGLIPQKLEPIHEACSHEEDIMK